MAVIGAVLLISQGAIQNFHAPTTIQTITGGQQTIPGGAVASQEVIKELGTNGGGYFNANSAHPFENPNAWTNMLEIFLILVIPVALTRTFGKMVGDTRQGWAVLAAMAVLYFTSLAVVMSSESSLAAFQGGGLEGKEYRLNVLPSSFFAVTTTMTSTGAVDSFHSSYHPLAGGMLILDMMLGEISPGGVGTGLYGMLMIALLSVFVAGLMVGRTPEYLGKRIGVSEITKVSLYILVMPTLVLAGVGISAMLPSTRESVSASGTWFQRHRLRLHFRFQQQRFGIRRFRRRYTLVQHHFGSLCMLLVLPSHRYGASPRRRFRQAKAGCGNCWHSSYPPSTVRGCHGWYRRHRRRPYLPTHPGSRPLTEALS